MLRLEALALFSLRLSFILCDLELELGGRELRCSGSDVRGDDGNFVLSEEALGFLEAVVIFTVARIDLRAEPVAVRELGVDVIVKLVHLRLELGDIRVVVYERRVIVNDK